MIIIVAVSHLLIYSLLPVVYHFRQRNELEDDVANLCEEIANTPNSERLSLVTKFAGKWWADVSVCYGGYTYVMNLLNAGESELLNSSDTTEVVNIIAEETDGKIKISLSIDKQNQYCSRQFLIKIYMLKSDIFINNYF